MITKDRLDDQLIALIGNNTRQSSKMLAEKLKVSRYSPAQAGKVTA